MPLLCLHSTHLSAYTHTQSSCPLQIMHLQLFPYMCSLTSLFSHTHTVLNAAEKQQLAVLEGQLAWMVSIVGSVIRGRLSSSSSSSSSAESQESLDGDLSARVFGLLRVLDAGIHQHRYAENSRQRLDMAVLGFFQNFRKVYIGEQVSSRGSLNVGVFQGGGGAVLHACVWT